MLKGGFFCRKGQREQATDPNAPKKDRIEFDNINIKLKFKVCRLSLTAIRTCYAVINVIQCKV